MDIKVRGVNPAIVKAIDEKAKISNQSRQNYLKDLIENFVMLKDFNDREAELKQSLEKNTKVIDLLADQLEKNNELLAELMEEEEEI